MHLLNDVGYPNHDVPETPSVIQLCSQLLMQSDSFFYTNDVKVFYMMR